MTPDGDTFRIEYERLWSVFRHAPLTLSVTVLNAVLVATVLAPADGARLSAGWAAAIAAVSAVRWFGGRRFLRRRPEETSCRRWATFSVLGALTTGVLWGGGSAVLFPAAEWYQVFLSLVVGGMCAGAITVNAAHVPTAVAFILPAALPLAASFLAQGPAWRVSALMVVIFAAALCMIGLSAHRTFGYRIRSQLALDRERQKLSAANVRLVEEAAQRRTAEATLFQVRKMEAIGHLTGGIAHDFNNLLQVIVGNTSLIQRLAQDNERILDYAQVAEQAAVRGADLIGSLLTFARRPSMDPVPVDINALLEEFEPLLSRTLGGTTRFEIVLAPDLPPCQTDPAQFQSAVLNLVINARDAMPSGGVLTVTTGLMRLGAADLAGNPEASPGRFVSVSVRDTGAGMTAAVMARVFEPFFTTKDVGKGSGLGLPQVYGFVRQAGGHIALVSTPNEGTEVTLWLPVLFIDDPVEDV
ncbi:MAG TPA: ATP-binding protein [Rhodopila sp.]